MRKDKRKYQLMIVLTAALYMGSGLNAYAADQSASKIQREYEFETTDLNCDVTEYFEPTIISDGKSYLLSSVSVEVLNEELTEGAYVFYDSPAFVDETRAEKPESTLLLEGVPYALKTFDIKEATVVGRTEYIKSEVAFDGIEWLEDVTQTSEITVTDATTGQEITMTMPFIKVVESQEIWVDTFEFPISISGYDADYFMLGNTMVSKSDDLVAYKDSFLSYLGLSNTKYKITSIEWNGLEYTQNGTVYRNATAYGQKKIYNVTALYGGDASLPAADGYQYHCIYVNAERQDSIVYTLKATAFYEYVLQDSGTKNSMLQNILEWLRANPIATFSIGTILLVLLILFIVFVLSGKKKDEKTNKVDIVDIE